MRRALLVLLGVLFFVVPVARDASAGSWETELVPVPGGRPGRVEVAVHGPDFVVPGEAWDFVRTTLRNTGGPRDVTVSVRSHGGSNLAGEHTRTVRLAPNETVRLDLPTPASADYLMVKLEAPGLEPVERWLPRGSTRARKTPLRFMVGEVGAYASEGSAPRPDQQRVLDAAGSPVPAMEWLGIAVADLPDRWTLLTGLSVLVVDGASVVDQPVKQAMLSTYTRAGGTLFLWNADRVGAGPLADLWRTTVEATTADEIASGKAGFGEWIALNGAWSGNTRAEMALGGAISRVSIRPDPALLSTSESQLLEIPGLGEVPARAFFFGVASFAALVGVAAFVLGRKGRRRTGLVVIIPVLGLLFCGGILGFGLLAEGLGTRGSIRTVTFLDQRSHEAVTRATRTLFAGIAPDALRVSPDTVLSSARYEDDDDDEFRYYRRRHSSRPEALMWAWSPAGVSVKGGMVPSRSQVGMGSLSAAKARERLRFRRRGSAFEVISEPAFAPLSEAGAVVLCTPEGAYFVSDAQGILQPLPEAKVEAAISDLVVRYWKLPLLPSLPEREARRLLRRVSIGMPRRPTTSGLASPPDSLVARSLPHGSYLAATRSCPGLDTLGLDVEWRAALHLVHGILAPEDIDG